jgi:hypothetical protein
MKLTKTQLKQIIKEEISNVLEIGMFHDPIGYVLVDELGKHLNENTNVSQNVSQNKITIQDLKKKFRELSSANLNLSSTEIDLIYKLVNNIINKSLDGSAEMPLKRTSDMFDKSSMGIKNK